MFGIYLCEDGTFAAWDLTSREHVGPTHHRSDMLSVCARRVFIRSTLAMMFVCSVSTAFPSHRPSLSDLDL